jgi:hypothetical protein
MLDVPGGYEQASFFDEQYWWVQPGQPQTQSLAFLELGLSFWAIEQNTISGSALTILRNSLFSNATSGTFPAQPQSWTDFSQSQSLPLNHLLSQSQSQSRSQEHAQSQFGIGSLPLNSGVQNGSVMADHHISTYNFNSSNNINHSNAMSHNSFMSNLLPGSSGSIMLGVDTIFPL